MSTLDPILVVNVDDRDAERYVKTRELERAGFSVVEAKTGGEALRAIEKHRPSLALLDVKLPDISGFEVCRYVKEKWPETMVLMTSATFTTASARVFGLDSGADSYLVQPAEPLELAAALNALLRIRQSEDALRSLNETLENRVAERTAELAEINAKLEAEMAERQKSEAALVQAQKMEAIGQLTSGIAHDFNNLLTAVVGNLDLIRSRSTEPRILRWSENALRAAQRGSKLTSQLLAFSRTQKLAAVPVNVNALIAGMRELLAQALGANVTIDTRLAVDLTSAMADVNQLELAILNLCINARDAMPGGGHIVIKTDMPAQNQGFVLISVEDSGTGMTPEVAARAFDPFFTTKPTGMGTGLGLSQVYGIVRQCGGDVLVETEVGKGTTVQLLLPCTEGHAVSEQPGDSPFVRTDNSERLLLVDDDPDVLEFVGNVLSELGYEVRQEASGSAAIDILEEFDPALLIIDFAMPGMNGAEVVRVCRQRNSKLLVLFLSGFADSNALETAVGEAPLLHKPFRSAELAATVRSLLDSEKHSPR